MPVRRGYVAKTTKIENLSKRNLRNCRDCAGRRFLWSPSSKIPYCHRCEQNNIMVALFSYYRIP